MKPSSNGMQLMEPVSPETLLPSIGLWPWWTGGILAVIAAIALCIWLARRRGKADPVALRRAAYQEALAGLDAVQTADPRDAAVRGSLVLRRYLSVAAADPALFETHEEFISRHDALAALKPEARSAACEHFTRLATLKYGPPRADAEAGDVVRDSRQVLETLHTGFAA
jgi:hypothetical protein